MPIHVVMQSGTECEYTHGCLPLGLSAKLWAILGGHKHDQTHFSKLRSDPPESLSPPVSQPNGSDYFLSFPASYSNFTGPTLPSSGLSIYPNEGVHGLVHSCSHRVFFLILLSFLCLYMGKKHLLHVLLFSLYC